jgi:hypothetical protein
MDNAGANKASLRAKAANELREFFVLALYLWLCFGALVLLKDSILEANGVTLLPLGFAAIKAAVTAKFVMIGRLLPVARQRTGERLIVSIVRRSLALLVLLVILTVIEEVVLALIHGRSVVEAVEGLGGAAGYRMGAMIAIMLLILIPYVAFLALDEALGEGTLRRLLLERQSRSE